MVPGWLHLLSIFALVLGFATAGVIMIDVVRHPQQMWIMDVVWPVVALFGTALTIWAYSRYGRLSTRKAVKNAKSGGRFEEDRPKIMGPVFARLRLNAGQGTDREHICSGCLTV